MRSASATMSVAGPSCILQSGTRPTTQQPSFCRLLATRSVCSLPQLQITHRAAMQHGRSSLAIAAGHASPDGTSSTTNLGAGRLYHQSSKRDFAVILAAEGTHGGDSVPRATRKQLDQFFTTLLNETNIAAQQNCDETDACMLEDEVRYGSCGGYCYYTEASARWLATEGCLDLTCGTCRDRMPVSEVAQTVYDTARACDLSIEFSWKSNDRASFEIAGFDPQEFAEKFAYLEGRKLFTVEDEDDDGIDAW